MFRLLKVVVFILALAVVSVLTTNCGTDHSQVRFVHASPDAGNVDVVVDGKTVATDLAFGAVSPSSDYLTVGAGTRKVEVRPTGTTNDMINSNVSLGSGKNYTAVVSGLANPAPGTIAAIVLTDDNSAPSSGNVKLRVVHASPSSVNIDVYIVAPGTDITGLTDSIDNLSFGQASTYQTVAPTMNEVIVTFHGEKTRRVDQTLTLAAGQVRTIVVRDVLNGGGIADTPIVLNDVN